jgi:hypothetical protein
MPRTDLADEVEPGDVTPTVDALNRALEYVRAMATPETRPEFPMIEARNVLREVGEMLGVTAHRMRKPLV